MDPTPIPIAPPSNRFLDIVHNSLTAWIILGLSLLLTIVAYQVSDQNVTRRAEDRFNFRALEIEQAIRDRLRVYEQILWSGVGLFYASDRVSRQEWRTYVDTLEIHRHWPGIQGLGYAIPLSAEQLREHEAQVQAEGYSDYRVHPGGIREHYSSIVYLEPFDWRNQRAFGYDMYSNPMRREAMDRARDLAQAATSGIITLIQETDENVQRGFLTYVPVYRSGHIPTTLKERREQLRGWVYAAFRAGDLMHGILGSSDTDIDFALYDGLQPMASALLYETPRLPGDAGNLFSKEVHLNVQGRPWTLELHGSTQVISDDERRLPILVLIAGVIIDLLLFYVILSLHFINRRTSRIARQLTWEYQAAIDREVQANQHKGEFLKRISHELRTPLNAIIGFTDRLLKRRSQFAPREVDALETIRRNGMSLLALINDLLDLTRIDEGRLTLNLTLVDLNALIREEFPALMLQAHEKGLKLALDLPDGPQWLISDKRLLDQILLNLASNAIKYTEEGQITLRLLHACDEQKRDCLMLSVEDTGIGISHEDQQKLFCEFSRSQIAIDRNIQGSGLGLTITRKLISLLGGQLTLHSTPGKGSCFYALLPVDHFSATGAVQTEKVQASP